ncbi:hypothetical protein [Mycolicibacterium sphagni]|jgi:hypothetical protein|uniref:Uncharacterized protein n=1 Tax=Mycolicibacterium sphagni TaxID=1786 RepID=A0A255DIT7_9MYCO|nr:hypothetical protein [Mycolicibacterium sphagni]MCV7178288.1 hypothetical protein [Mycolicibacterium sphagni]OYN79184.1 hypothetical protein CG716_12485 [Mycolicibacterium sphagni]
MNMWTKTAAGAVLGGSLLVAGGFGLASAAPDAPMVPQPQAPQPTAGGQLNVGLTVNGQQVGTIQNVSLNSAQTLATSVCPSDDLSSKLPQLANNQIQTVPACSGASGVSYTFTTNASGSSNVVAPAESSGTSGIGSTATPAMPGTPSSAEAR